MTYYILIKKLYIYYLAHKFFLVDISLKGNIWQCVIKQTQLAMNMVVFMTDLSQPLFFNDF